MHTYMCICYICPVNISIYSLELKRDKKITKYLNSMKILCFLESAILQY